MVWCGLRLSRVCAGGGTHPCCSPWLRQQPELVDNCHGLPPPPKFATPPRPGNQNQRRVHCSLPHREKMRSCAASLILVQWEGSCSTQKGDQVQQKWVCVGGQGGRGGDGASKACVRASVCAGWRRRRRRRVVGNACPLPTFWLRSKKSAIRSAASAPW